MIYHQSYATQGLHPTYFSTLQVANLGAFYVEAIIEPIAPSFIGTGGRASRAPQPREYKVTVKVKFEGKEYQHTQVVDNKVAKVMASVLGIDTFTDDKIMVSVNSVQVKQ